MSRDENEVGTILAKTKRKLVNLNEKRQMNIARMHKLRITNEKIELLIEQLTGKPFETPVVAIERTDA